ncbi:MAG: ribosomal-protein-alanine N-acetyltransferase RimI [Roseibaca calidilacus]|uniref:[Ribosomal protein bS18]-alanine N-acetyltransferase n=1 Tax=Roseibaca calidilacus TaxID=1666912 RepID=A0A0P7YWS5_9RHOB|nr:ribosomal protein S18-alanine N-acetyltransferase [Roseibaca calidilacus]KPP93480.1 MAG: ribosomal-protein-alanine N-acetyltransferase RimI [Roseibaca calidilacus]CUX80591.1 ribosomal-protein-alanine N-acetyltransferase [Roseibaca calidilacus]
MTPDALAAIHKAAFPHDPWSRADLAGYMSDPAALLVARPEGFILLRIVLDEAEVLTFAVAPQAQGRGMGAALLAQALAQAKSRGVGRIFLEVAADNAPARALYARAGFRETGLRKGYYARPGAPPVDALTLEYGPA